MDKKFINISHLLWQGLLNNNAGLLNNNAGLSKKQFKFLHLNK